jgi:hypothetical protein
MSNREKLLAAVVLAMMALWGGAELAANYRDALASRRAELAAARERLLDAKLALARGEQAVKRLDAWQQQSLPTNRVVAQSLHRTWLLERCQQAGLTVDLIQPSQPSVPTATQSAVAYNVTAEGTIESAVKLLYEFYRSTLLQKITRLELRPAADPSRWHVTLTAEALSLGGATHEDNLPEGVTERFAATTEKELVEGIAGRNLFATYRPPRREPPRVAADRPPPAKFDDAKFAIFTGAVGNGNAFQAWVHVRTTNEYLRLSAGDEIKVGLFEGRVMAVEPRALTVETGDKSLRVELGASLRDGKEVSDRETTEAAGSNSGDT